MKASSFSYKSAGVDIDAGNRLVERIKPALKRTRRVEILGGVGGFAASSLLPEGYKKPVLVSATDGVGTKLKLAVELDRLDTVGIDLVAMCANDVLAAGGEPLFFLDYFATGQLNVEAAATVIEGIANGCEQAGCALIGGETAEMPGMYRDGDFDLAGFCVGVAEYGQQLHAGRVQAGDVLLALPSSGLHSNGYSLVRKLLENIPALASAEVSGQSLADMLLQPTRIYATAMAPLLRSPLLHSAAHITGGGLLENLPRALPADLKAVIVDMGKPPPIFEWLQQRAELDDDELYRTFNYGIGMVLCIASAGFDRVAQILNECGENFWKLGIVRPRNAADEAIEFNSKRAQQS